MVYAGDLWIQLPVRDLYDTLMMAMAINAARDMYNRGEEKLDKFYEKYNDFTSPILKDMDAYNNIIGGVKDTINNIYARGGDPLRNAQDRAEMMAAIRNVPVDKINKLKQSAEAAKEYIKNRGVLEAKGLYNPDFEERYLRWDLNNWDTLKGGVWNRTSPAEFKTLKEATNDWYNNRTPGQLTEEQVKAFGIDYDPRYTYTGFGDDELLNIARNNTPGWLNSVWANYYRDVAEQQVAAKGEDVTPEAVEKQLQRNIADAQQEWLVKPTKKADEYAVLEQKHKNAVALENLNHKHAMARQAAAGKGSGRGKGDQNVPVIFREAAARAGGEVNYAVDQNPHYQWIDPLVQGARVVKGGKGNYAYNIPASQTAFIYKKNERNFDGSRVSARFDYGFANSDATFIPTGQMRMEVDFNGQPHYYITGTLANNNTGREVIGRDGTELYEMEVTERAFNYGKKQATAYYPTN